MTMLGTPQHLIKRFFVSVFDQGYDKGIESNLLALLNGREKSLYYSQPRMDRLHSLRNAKSVIEETQTGYDNSLVVAAALHDVGKAEANLGVFGRVFATVLHGILPIEILESWNTKEGFRKNTYHYCFHSERGAALLEEAGSMPIVVTWARQHHNKQPDGAMTAEIFALLKRADQK
tara:strand:- start:159 stop:686 length:528 start_codon:yes stop_codon:yes gene_type:complete